MGYFTILKLALSECIRKSLFAKGLTSTFHKNTQKNSFDFHQSHTSIFHVFKLN